MEYLKTHTDNRTLIKEVLTAPVLFQKPKYLNGQRFDSTPEILYCLEKQGNLDILKAIYPIDSSDMRQNGKINALVLHHTGNRGDYSVPKILRFQTERTGWAAIGYHYVINGDGVIINTRQLEFEGAHVYGHNHGNIGIVLSKNLNSSEPTKEMLEATNNLIRDLQEKYLIPNNQIYGHIQFVIETINKKIEQEGTCLERLCEKDFLNAQSTDEFKDLKWKYTKIFNPAKSATSKGNLLIKEVNQEILHLRACPGVNFYKHLRQLRQNEPERC